MTAQPLLLALAGWGTDAPQCGGAPSVPGRQTTIYICVESGLLQSVLNGVVGNHLSLEGVSTGFGRLHHLDDFAICAAFTFLQRGHGFLCHILGVLYMVDVI